MNRFEQSFSQIRYVSIIAVIASAFGSLLMIFGGGCESDQHQDRLA